jgi:hypothetical protein
MGQNMNAYSVLVGNPEGKRSVGKPRHSWDNNVKNGSERKRMGLIWTGLF